MDIYSSKGSTVPQDIEKQINLLVSTPVGTVVFDREFGIDMSFIDMPQNVAQNMFAAELAEKIEKYIDGVVFQSATFSGINAEGKLICKVVVDIE